MPEVSGVTWATAGSASYTARCKDGEAENTVSETCPKSGDSCIVSCQHQKNSVKFRSFMTLLGMIALSAAQSFTRILHNAILVINT